MDCYSHATLSSAKVPKAQIGHMKLGFHLHSIFLYYSAGGLMGIVVEALARSVLGNTIYALTHLRTDEQKFVHFQCLLHVRSYSFADQLVTSSYRSTAPAKVNMLFHYFSLVLFEAPKA